MSRNANLALYFPESKWTGVSTPKAFCRSVIAHSCFITAIVLIGANTRCPLRQAEYGVSIELVPALVKSAPSHLSEGRDVVPVTFPDPDAEPEKLVNHQIPQPTTRRAPLINRTATNLLNTIPKNTLAVAIALPDQTAPPIKAAAKMHPLGTGTPFVGAPARPAQARSAGRRNASQTKFEPEPELVKPIFPIVPIYPTPAQPSAALLAAPHMVASYAVHPGWVPSAEKDWLELDGKACSIYEQADALAATNPAEAKRMYGQSRDLMHEVLQILDRRMTTDKHALIAEATRNTARCYDRLGDFEMCEKLFQKSVGMFTNLEGPESKNAGISMTYLGDTLMKEGKHEQALEQFKLSLPIYEKHYRQDSKEVSWAHQRIDSANSALKNAASK